MKISIFNFESGRSQIDISNFQYFNPAVAGLKCSIPGLGLNRFSIIEKFSFFHLLSSPKPVYPIKIAGDLTHDDEVICSDGSWRRLVCVMASWHGAEVVSVKFSPDETVAAHLPPSVSILTKGQRRRAMRRSQRRGQRWEPSEEVLSIPDTAAEYSS